MVINTTTIIVGGIIMFVICLAIGITFGKLFFGKKPVEDQQFYN